MRLSMRYKLMIKTHLHTDMMYMCITKKDNWEKYLGSGLYWRRHLEKHGKHIKSELLYSCDDYDAFLEKCKYYSDMYDVANNPQFANLIPEYGYDNIADGWSNWWKNLTDNDKNEFVSRRAEKCRENHWSLGGNYDSIRNKISQILKDKHKNDPEFSADTVKVWHAGFSKMFTDKEEAYFNWKNSISAGMKNYFRSISDSERELIGKRNRASRLSLSEEKKVERARKIKLKYDSGVHAKLFDRYSKERRGTENPAAKLITYDDKVYTRSEFKIFLKDNDITKRDADIKLNDKNNTTSFYHEYEVKDYGVTTCPHCSKYTNGKPSAFKRWHFDNCKEK